MVGKNHHKNNVKVKQYTKLKINYFVAYPNIFRTKYRIFPYDLLSCFTYAGNSRARIYKPFKESSLAESIPGLLNRL